MHRLALILLLVWQPARLAAQSVPYDLDRLGVPRFVNTNYIDLENIFQISKFRSSAGHDYSDDIERCRSMKHYFMRPDASAAIRNVAGELTRAKLAGAAGRADRPTAGHLFAGANSSVRPIPRG